jgi:putative nucleotidyltransferase with HDIG domain
VSRNTSKEKGDKGQKKKNGAVLPRLAWNREVQWSVIFWATVVVLALLLLPSSSVVRMEYEEGDIAQRDIKASQSYLVEDPASTQARKLEAEASVLAVYDYDRQQIYLAVQRIKAFFVEARELLAAQAAGKALLDKRLKETPRAERKTVQEEVELFSQQSEEERKQLVGAFVEEFSLEISYEDFSPLLRDGFSEKAEGVLVESFQPVRGLGIVADRETLIRERGKGVAVRDLQTVSEEMVLDDFTTILALEDARAQVKKGFGTVRWSKSELALRRLLEELSRDLVRPNFTFNRSETDDRKKAAVEETNPVYLQVKKGEIIVRAGDPLTGDQILKISAMETSGPGVSRASVVLGTFLLVALLLFVFFLILRAVQQAIATDTRNLLILVTILALQMAIIRSGLALSQALSATYTGVPEGAMLLALPFAMGAMTAATLFPTAVGLVVAVLSAILGSVVTDYSMSIFIYALIGGVVASFSVVHCYQRSSIIRAGLLVSGANIAVTALDRLVAGVLISSETLYLMIFAASGGIIISLVVSLVIPLIESAFNVATDMKLMELANLNQPVLKDMILKAPGSYHHSVLVGSLAEAAAEEIGANPLLTRVAASYHDIGKMSKPEYFVENQEDRDNRHEKLSPNMSALILAAHVKDGAEIAREFRLPRRVVDAIVQHHGTRLITFFYNKAKEQEDPSVQTVDERDFRYPGPRPQSREAALIMLADAVEAASKVLTDPTPARIRGLVQKIMNDIFVDGQLDESNLTLQDLHKVARSFTRTITGIMHHRIDYPESPTSADEKKDKKDKKEKKKDDPVDEPEPEGGTVPEEADGAGVKNIKRLGQS